MCGAERDGAKAAAERSAVPSLRLLPAVFSFCLGGGEKRVVYVNKTCHARRRRLAIHEFRRAALSAAAGSKGNGAAPRLRRSWLCLHRSGGGRSGTSRRAAAPLCCCLRREGGSGHVPPPPGLPPPLVPPPSATARPCRESGGRDLGIYLIRS